MLPNWCHIDGDFKMFRATRLRKEKQFFCCCCSQTDVSLSSRTEGVHGTGRKGGKAQKDGKSLKPEWHKNTKPERNWNILPQGKSMWGPHVLLLVAIWRKQDTEARGNFVPASPSCFFFLFFFFPQWTTHASTAALPATPTYFFFFFPRAMLAAVGLKAVWFVSCLCCCDIGVVVVVFWGDGGDTAVLG